MAKSGARASQGVLAWPTYTRQPRRAYPAVFFQAAEAIHPATSDDLLDGPKRTVEYAAIFLENEHLKLTILPGLGGKIWSLFDKDAGDEVLYVPDVIRPSLIAVNGAWIPGGIEYNFPVGHHVATMAEAPCAILESGPERAVVRTEIIHPHSGLRLEVNVILRAGESRFDLEYTAWNPSATPQRWGFWCNAATWAHEDWQFFSKARYYHTGHMLHDYPVDRFGVDTSWLKNRFISSDSFMMGSRDNFFGFYDHRRSLGLAHVSADRSMQGMKYHTFGTELRNYWSEACFTEDGRNYTEIQSGRHETQMDFGVLQPGGSERFRETWMPYRGTGGIDWMDRDVLFQVRDGAPLLYAFADCEAALSVDGRTVRKRLRAGEPVRFPQRAGEGCRVKLAVDGRTVLDSRFPYPGRHEPGAKQRILAQHGHKPLRQPTGAAEHLAAARQLFLYDRLNGAVAHYRAVLAAQPKQAEAAFELAGCLWRLGEFAEGARLLRGLARTRLKAEAAARLARRSQAEEEYFGAALRLPAGAKRDLALAACHAGRNNAEAARPLLAKALRARSDQPLARYLMGMLALRVDKDPAGAARHLAAALAAAPGDRELTLELALALNLAGKPEQTLRLLAAAPKAVRELSACRKAEVRARFETGDLRRCHDLMRTKRLFNWEGELWHLDAWINTCTGLAEMALARGRPAEALRWATAADSFPPTLGMQMKHMSHARRRFWQGAALRAAGRQPAAAAAFRDGVVAMLAEKERRLLGPYGVCWTAWVTPEDAYMLLRCAEAADDAALIGQARALVDELLATKRIYGNGPDPVAVRAMLAAFNRDFTAAAHLLQQAIRSTPWTRLLTLHLAAVRRGRRRAG